MAAAKDPWLLTPGPLTTSAATKEAMLHDWGSRDAQFIETNARVLRRLLDIAGAAETHVCVPLQGSGTFAVEAALGTLSEREAQAMTLRFGLDDGTSKTLKWAGQIMGLSAERVRQLEVAALRKLREPGRRMLLPVALD